MWLDPYTDAVAQIPYTRLGFASIGTMVARRVFAFLRRPRKVIVVDCDGTLWSGAVGEDGPLGVTVDANQVSFQRFLVDQAANGRLLCICSKNSERDVFEVLDRHPDMLLRREQFAAWRINWLPKPQNVESLAQELGLASESFIFIDNEPGECAAMRYHCPDVLTVELPSDSAQIEDLLLSVWEFDVSGITAEDKNRTAFYLENAVRVQVERSAPTLNDFLAGLELEVTVEPIQLRDLARASDLTVRTTQFNLDGRRWSEAELRAKAEQPGSLVLVTSAQDKFGKYGAVGLMVCSLTDTLSVDCMLLSCRALGKRIEHRMVLAALEAAGSIGTLTMEFSFIETERNAPARAFLKELSASCIGEGHWRVDVYSTSTTCRAALEPFQKPTTNLAIPLGSRQ